MPTILFGISSSFCAHFMKGQLAYFAAKGFRVVVVSGAGEEIESLCAEEKAHLITVPFSRSITPFHDLQLLFRLMDVIKEQQPDIINAGNPKPGLLLTMAAWLLAKRGRIFTMHGLVSDARRGWKGSLIRWFEKLSCSLANKVLVVSPSLAQHAINQSILSAKKAVVVLPGSYNGIDLHRFSKTAAVMLEVDKWKQQLGIREGQLVYGFVGRITQDKGIGLMLDAFQQLRQSYPHAVLLMVGPADHENPLPASVQDKLEHGEGVISVGMVKDIVPIYPLLDVLVLGSYREGFGNVLVEAAAMEVPVIAPIMPGCADAMQVDVNGKGFTKGDVSALYDAMLAYARDPALRARHGKAGRTFAAKFDPQMIWEGQLRLYRSIMDK